LDTEFSWIYSGADEAQFDEGPEKQENCEVVVHTTPC